MQLFSMATNGFETAKTVTVVPGGSGKIEG